MIHMLLLIACFTLLMPADTVAAKLAPEVLPSSTQFCYSVSNSKAFYKSLSQTQWGQLLTDPALKPFLNDLPRQLRNEASHHPLGTLWIDLGVDNNDLKELTVGSITWALVQLEQQQASRVMIADVSQDMQRVSQLLKQIDASLVKQKATKQEIQLENVTCTTYSIPAIDNLAARKLCYFLHQELLVFTESVSVSKSLLNNLSHSSKETLKNDSGFQQVMNESQRRMGKQTPDAWLYVKPIDLLESLHQISPNQEVRVQENLKILRKQKFDGISAVGGYLNVGGDPFDFQIRLAVYAPKPWKNGMQICQFPNQQVVVPEWITSHCSGFWTMNIDFKNFALQVAPLFDDIYGEGETGLYDDLKNTLKEDPEGPQIDIDKEIFGLLTPQTTLLARETTPVTPDSPERLLAFSTKNEQALAAVVKKVFTSDPAVKVVKIKKHDVYLSYIEDEDAGFGPAAKNKQKKQPAFVTCVAKGHLMFATDVNILEHVLTSEKSQALSQHAEYKKMLSHWKLSDEKIALMSFGRLKDLLRTSHELLRQGKEPNSGKSLKGLLSNIAAGEPPEIDKPDFDGSQLPPFDKLDRKLGSGGLIGISTESGWFLEGFVLKQP